MAELPVLPIAVAALIADTTHMTAEQFGAYMRVLLAMWMQGAELKDNDTALAQITGTGKHWRAIRDVVLAPVNVADGMLHQKRLSETWDQVQRLRVQRVSAAGKRWRKEHASAYASAYPNGHAKPVRADMREASERNAILKEKKITTNLSGAARASENPAISTTGSLDEVIKAKGWVQS